ncbi:hypothetical protein [Candidatus Similichlamydia laticola]|uniref:Uncharacterized protein n=1 Tax=Candidatus Similichlamydia laticola TaxID=2170265 RepID=A0A369KFM6_9BACT|nr:hypothetical protein [Candidatus Similichlamydia laticola]RDB31707.1 hypothetical protein HAT2_00216 [Candidatus Similichlamydia laticola]
MSYNTLLYLLLFSSLLQANSSTYKRAQEKLYQDAEGSHVLNIKIIYDTLRIEPLPGDIPTSAGHFVEFKTPKLKALGSRRKEEEIIDIITTSSYIIKPRRKLFDLYAKIEAIPERVEALLVVDLPPEYQGKAAVDGNPILLSKEPKLVLKGIIRFFGVATVRYTLRGPRKIIENLKTNEFKVSFTVIDSTLSD